MEYLFNSSESSKAIYTGKVAETIDFVIKKQLTDKALWKKFANQYIVRLDSSDCGWRGEYWGKMMRGGCLTYMYSADEELYDSLTFAVEELLKTEDAYGRISTYTVETEFTGWDMWCRKYVLSGLQHYYKICKDENLKSRVLTSMKQTADYICEHIGVGKIDIRTTSGCWGGVNSCSILEPFVELYKLTQEKRYLKFAEYIIKSGGCIDGNLLGSAVKKDYYPYQYPEVKAYETMSFFEGVLAYYEVMGEKGYLDLVKKFVEDVYNTERTVVGGVGGKSELFDNFYIHQTEKQSTVIQETCVTVTWIRLLARLYFNTGNVEYIDRIERSGFNALWGSLNTEWNKCYSSVAGKFVPALPFDSYSPLVYDKRGREVGGFRIMEDGSNYGCCACIGSAGVALLPLLAALKDDSGIVINYYFNGGIKTTTSQGNAIYIDVKSKYPVYGKIGISVHCETKEKFVLKLRKPNWSDKTRLVGADYTEKDGYYVIDKEWKDDEIILGFSIEIKAEKLNGKTALTYGPIVLALDESNGNKDIDKGIYLIKDSCEIKKPDKKEMFRYCIKKENGDGLIFTDYASSGKNWAISDDRISVWLDVCD